MVFRRIRILPLLIIVAFMAMSLRIGEIIHYTHNLGEASARASDRAQRDNTGGAQSGDDAVKINVAQLKTGAGDKGGGNDKNGNAQKSAQKGDKKQADKGKKDAGMSASSSPIGNVDLDGAKEQEWPDASNTAARFSDKRMKLYKDLAERRKELNKRAEKLEKKKALLKAAEKELDQKYQELKKLRNEIKSLLKRQSEQKEKRISSLVKIYSGMKADDAARIFNTLEMNVLVEVMSRMSERNLAPILAEMDSEKARKVTMLLAEEKDLPSMPQKLNN